MNVSSVSASSGSSAQPGAEAAALVARKVLDATQREGEQLAKLIAQAGGVGQNVDTKA